MAIIFRLRLVKKAHFHASKCDYGKEQNILLTLKHLVPTISSVRLDTS